MHTLLHDPFLSVFMRSDLLTKAPPSLRLINCRDSLHNRRHDNTHTLFHDSFMNVFMWSDLFFCRDSLHNRRHDGIHTLLHDPFLNVFMRSDLLTKAVNSNKAVEKRMTSVSTIQL